MYNYVGIVKKSSAISKSLKCHFLGEKKPNLITCNISKIHVFDLCQEGLKPNQFINVFNRVIDIISIPDYGSYGNKFNNNDYGNFGNRNGNNYKEDTIMYRREYNEEYRKVNNQYMKINGDSNVNNNNNNNNINNNVNKNKDNLFVLTEDLDYCILSYDKANKKIDTVLSGSIKEDIGKRQDKILCSLDNTKNFILVCAYCSILRLICINPNIKLKDEYKDYRVKHSFTEMLFLDKFLINNDINDNKNNINNINNNNNNNDIKYIPFTIVKTVSKEKTSKDQEDKPHIIETEEEMLLETIVFKVERGEIKVLQYEDKSNINNDNNSNNSNNNDRFNLTNINKPNYTSIYNDPNFYLYRIDLTSDPTISYIIPLPHGKIALFFAGHVQLFSIYINNNIFNGENNINNNNNNNNYDMLPLQHARVAFDERRFCSISEIGEGGTRFFVADEEGNLFLFAVIHENNNTLNTPNTNNTSNTNNNNNNQMQIEYPDNSTNKNNINTSNINTNSNNNINTSSSSISLCLQYLGEIGPSSSITYIDNRVLFVGSLYGRSSLVRVEVRETGFVHEISSFESLAPISDMLVLQGNNICNNEYNAESNNENISKNTQNTFTNPNDNTNSENTTSFINGYTYPYGCSPFCISGSSSELVLVSGIGKNCALKSVKRGAQVDFVGEIDIQGVKDTFCIYINKELSIVFVSLPNTVIAVEYNMKGNNIKKYEGITFNEGENIIYTEVKDDILYMVTTEGMRVIKIEVNENAINMIELAKKNIKTKPLMAKFSKKLFSMFIYLNDASLIRLQINFNKNETTNNTEINIIESILLSNTQISAFDLCCNFLVFSEWGSTYPSLISFSNNSVSKLMCLNEPPETLITDICIIKQSGVRKILFASSSGRLIILPMKTMFRELKTHVFTLEDFGNPKKISIAGTPFSMKKLKNNSKSITNKFSNSTTDNNDTGSTNLPAPDEADPTIPRVLITSILSSPSVLSFSRASPEASEFDVRGCLSAARVSETRFLFVFSGGLAFGDVSSVQSVNVSSKGVEGSVKAVMVLDIGGKGKDKWNKGDRDKICDDRKGKENEIRNNDNYNISPTMSNNNKNISYILCLHENSLVLRETNTLSEICRLNVGKENEVLTSMAEISFDNYNFYKTNNTKKSPINTQNNTNNTTTNISFIDTYTSKYIVIGSGICLNESEEPLTGYLRIFEINILGNMREVVYLETRGAVSKLIAKENIIYTASGNTLCIYSVTPGVGTLLDIKLIRKCEDFSQINELYFFNHIRRSNIFSPIQESNISENHEQSNNALSSDIPSQNEHGTHSKTLSPSEKVESLIFDDFANLNEFAEPGDMLVLSGGDPSNEADVHQIIIADVFRSVSIYAYDVNNDVLNETCRDFGLEWVFSISKCRQNMMYTSDIDGNLATLEYEIFPRSDQEKFKLSKCAYINLGERINVMIPTVVRSKELSDMFADMGNTDNKNINDNNNINNINSSSVNNQSNKIISNNSSSSPTISLPSVLTTPNPKSFLPQGLHLFTFFGTLEGSLGLVLELPRPLFELLSELEKSLLSCLEFPFSIPAKRGGKGFVRGEILNEFLALEEEGRKKVVENMRYPWKRSIEEIGRAVETLAKMC